MTCDQCRGIEGMFGRREAQRQAQQYRKRGAQGTTRMLIEALRAEHVEGLTLLDIGGGIGTIQLELLKSGVVSATDVDAATGYLAVAKDEAARDGLEGRIEYHYGDFTALAGQIAPAGIVTLDRVICCYHNMRDLVALSAHRATKLYGVVYPRDVWWMRIAVAVVNGLQRLRRDPFRLFVHPTAEVDELARSSGLVERYHRTSGPWQVVVYARAA